MNDSEPMENEKNMDTTVEISQKDLGFWKELLLQVRLVWRLIRDPEVPFYLKLMPLAAALYFISPIDLIPGLAFPGIGALDDLTALLVGAKLFVEFVPPYLVARHTNELEAEMTGVSPKEQQFDADAIIIEGEFRAKND